MVVSEQKKSCLNGLLWRRGLRGVEKIIKRFKSSSDNAIILELPAWEGLDFPSSQLELLIVTRLPFESPDRPMTKAMYNLLKDQGKARSIVMHCRKPRSN